MILVNIIKIIHLIIVLAVISAPFINNYKLKETIYVFLIYLLLQYISGYEKCGLTYLEYLIMGEKYKEGFMYRLIKPIIKISESYFDKYIIFVHLIYIYVLHNQLNSMKK
jgi:hypothetical protein